MLKKLIMIAAVFISGCAAQVTTLPVAGIERSEAVRVKDLRPETEKQGEIFSVLITSDAYALYRIADTAVAPSVTRLLQHRAFEKFGSDAKPLNIQVHHLAVYSNMQSEFRKSAVGASIGGVLGALVAGAATKDPSGASSTLVDGRTFEELAEEEYKRALYTEAENPGRGSAYIVYVDADIRGKRVFSRTFAPMRTKEGDGALSEALEAAMRFHLSQY